MGLIDYRGTVETLRKVKGLAEAPMERRRARSCLAIMVIN
jgi:hypothetical protein